MPEFTLPQSADEWDDVTQMRVHADYELTQSWLKSDGAPHNGLDLAAASRLLEHEKNVTELAKWMCRKFGSPSDSPSDFEPDARRILEDAK